jgi:hypothetical protein
MSLKKTVAIAAAAGALTAIAMPAMAFENEAHGSFVSRFILSNYDNGGVAQVSPSQYRADAKANNYIEQRARLQYIAKASDDLKLVTHFELDTKFGGDKTGKYGVSSDAGVYDGDGINLETKHVYLDFNLGKSVNMKTGLLPMKDSIKGVFLDADVTGLVSTFKLDPVTLTAAYVRYKTDSSIATTAANGAQSSSYFGALTPNATEFGHNNADLFILDTKFAINKDANIGLLYALMSDYTSATPTTVNLLGLNADAKIGSATLSGFFALQTGKTYTGIVKKAQSGYAGNVAAKMPLGSGTFRTAFLYLSGDGDTSNGNNTAWLNSGYYTYGESNLWIFARTGAGGTSSDRTITGAQGPGNKGLWLYTLGYDMNLTPKLFLNSNLGFSWVAKNTVFTPGPTDAKTGARNGSNFQGTEINTEFGYKVYDNMIAKLQVAYAMLGGYYAGSAVNSAATAAKDPENPYSVRVAWSYAF